MKSISKSWFLGKKMPLQNTNFEVFTWQSTWSGWSHWADRTLPFVTIVMSSLSSTCHCWRSGEVWWGLTSWNHGRHSTSIILIITKTLKKVRKFLDKASWILQLNWLLYNILASLTCWGGGEYFYTKKQAKAYVSLPEQVERTRSSWPQVGGSW